MIIGLPKEIKAQESRVGLTPQSVEKLVSAGNTVIFEKNAGIESGFLDEEYVKSGGKLVNTASEVFMESELIIKVKEPLSEEVKHLRPGQILFTYLHLAANKSLTEALLKSQCVSIAYEAVTDDSGKLPLLAPMSEVAGRMSIQAGAYSLERKNKGRGLLLSGATGVSPADVLILGGGVVGTNAADIALGLQSNVTILDISNDRLKELESRYSGKIQTALSNFENIKEFITKADLVVGGVLIPGAEAPRLVTKGMIKTMRPGSVIVDVAIDQGGCIETSRPTTHADPIYLVDNVVHYCVANMPGGVPRTSTMALNNATLPFILQLSSLGLKKALQDKNFLAGLNTYKGDMTCKPVADHFGIKYVEPGSVIH